MPVMGCLEVRKRNGEDTSRERESTRENEEHLSQSTQARDENFPESCCWLLDAVCRELFQIQKSMLKAGILNFPLLNMTGSKICNSELPCLISHKRSDTTAYHNFFGDPDWLDQNSVVFSFRKDFITQTWRRAHSSVPSTCTWSEDPKYK